MALNLKQKYPDGHLLRVTFEKDNSEKPVFYEVITKLNIPINIVSANIKNTQAGALGVMYIHIEMRQEIAPLIEELQRREVKVEVI